MHLGKNSSPPSSAQSSNRTRKYVSILLPSWYSMVSEANKINVIELSSTFKVLCITYSKTVNHNGAISKETLSKFSMSASVIQDNCSKLRSLQYTLHTSCNEKFIDAWSCTFPA